MAFTREELEELYKEQLCNLAEYYGVEANMRMLKGEIIDIILEASKPPVAEKPNMSVRIQRIYEQTRS